MNRRALKTVLEKLDPNFKQLEILYWHCRGLDRIQIGGRVDYSGESVRRHLDLIKAMCDGAGFNGISAEVCGVVLDLVKDPPNFNVDLSVLDVPDPEEIVGSELEDEELITPPPLPRPPSHGRILVPQSTTPLRRPKETNYTPFIIGAIVLVIVCLTGVLLNRAGFTLPGITSGTGTEPEADSLLVSQTDNEDFEDGSLNSSWKSIEGQVLVSGGRLDPPGNFTMQYTKSLDLYEVQFDYYCGGSDHDEMIFTFNDSIRWVGGRGFGSIWQQSSGAEWSNIQNSPSFRVEGKLAFIVEDTGNGRRYLIRKNDEYFDDIAISGGESGLPSLYMSNGCSIDNLQVTEN